MESMQIEMWPLKRLHPYAGNPRTPGASVKAIANSIRRFGFRQPIVCSRDGEIICGHGRFGAAQLLRLAAVPVHVVDGLTPTELRAYRIADNKIADIAEWDIAGLAKELAALDDIDMSRFGFEAGELEALELRTRLDREFAKRSAAQQKNLDTLHAMRSRGNKDVAQKRDSENYLVVMFRGRKEKEVALVHMGLPPDSRYVTAERVTFHRAPASKPGKIRPKIPKAASAKHSGRTG